MNGFPPLPPGFRFEEDERPDPWKILQAEGFTATNGFRAPADIERIRAQGYRPSPTSHHNRGDGVDLNHPQLSPEAQTQRLRELAQEHGWSNAEIINEGHHRHLGIPGWGAAPGTPGTPNSGLPALPEGFTLEQRGALTAGNFWEQAQSRGPTQPRPQASPLAAPVLPQWQAEPIKDQVSTFLGAPTQSSPDPTGAAAQTAQTGSGNYSATDQISDRYRSMMAEMQLAIDEGKSRGEILGIASRYEVPAEGPWVKQLDEVLAWRAANPGKRAQNVVPQTDFVQREAPSQPERAEISAHRPNIAERLGDTFGSAIEPIMGRFGATEAGNNLQALLSDWSPIGAFDLTLDAERRRQDALNDGRMLDAAGNHVARDFWALGAIPIIGRTQKAAGEAVEQIGRQVDRIDISDLPPMPQGFTLEPQIGRVQPLGQQPDPQDIAAVARSIRPEDVRPIPSNRVEDLAEFDRANPGTIQPVRIPRPETMLQMRDVPSVRSGKNVRFRGPLDAEAFLRSRGGLQDQGGELRHIGITNNKARQGMGQETRLGPILNPTGLTFDEAGEVLWEAGYFPERPLVDDVINMLRESRGGRPLYHRDDLDEVADFEGAQAQRWQAEAAEQEGSPLGQQVGEPIGFDDLDNMEPPATAYEELPRIGGTVGNINLGNIESVTDIRRLLQNVETRFGGFDAARRGKITHNETQALASELGLTADDLLRRRRGQALNAEQALAARQLLAKSSDEVLSLASKATGSAASDETRAAFSAALVRHAAIHEQVSGATAEAGRALSAMRVLARSKDVSGRIHQAAVDGVGGQQRLEDIAQGILDLQNQGVGPGGINRFAADAMRPRLRDKLVELWYNSLLSGPQTHAVNILSNSMTAALQIPEQAVAAGIGYARRGVRAVRGQEDDFDRVMFSELGPRVVGLLQGAKEGARAAGKAFMTGEVTDYVTKVESAMQHAIPGKIGSVVRTPTRALAAEDEFFKGVARRMEINALAVRQARREGLRGDAFKQRVADIAASPPPEMLERVMDYARYVTFQRPLEGIASDLSRLTQRQPALKLFLPFIRTPTNIFKFAIARSPLAPVLKEVRKDFAAGGEKQAVAAARIALGTGLGLLVTQWAADGTITGSGPRDRGKRDLLIANGWQPYSIKIGDTYHSYQRLDPVAMTLGTAADLAEFAPGNKGGDLTKLGAEFIASIISNLSNKTWLSGVSDVVGVIDDPHRNLDSFTARLAGSIAVPTGVAQIARTTDPTQREARGAWNRIQSRIPGVSQSLPARRDVFGQEMVNEGGLGPDFMSPIWTKQGKNDPIAEELLRIDAKLGRPSRTLKGERLSDRDYNRYQQLAGEYIRDDLAGVMANGGWKELDDEQRRELVNRLLRGAREDARADLFTQLPAMPPGFELQ